MIKELDIKGIWPPKWPVSEKTRNKISLAKTGVKINRKKIKKTKLDLIIDAKINELFGGEGYTSEWTNSLKNSIRERDLYRCRVCGKLQGDKQHPIHHIDYNKTNNNPTNLITLCSSCHGKTNGSRINRMKWKKFFKFLILNK